MYVNKDKQYILVNKSNQKKSLQIAAMFPGINVFSDFCVNLLSNELAT